jgi:hypothetical protein
MDNCIFKPNDNFADEMYYCLIGTEDFIDGDGSPRVNNGSSSNIAAKCIQNKKTKVISQNSKNKFSYFIRSSPNSDLYNPINLLSPIKNKRQYNFIDNICKNEWSFIEVNKNIFDKYIKFLTTKNISWLKEAIRDLK